MDHYQWKRNGSLPGDNNASLLGEKEWITTRGKNGSLPGDNNASLPGEK